MPIDERMVPDMKLFTLTLGVALPCVFHATASAQWRDSDQIATTVDTTLAQVRAHPEAFRNVKLRFQMQFASLGNVSNPFFTPFVASDFANFHAWGAEQPIWRKAEFDDMFGLLFLSKTSKQLQTLYDAKVFTHFKATGLVRNTFQGRPWIEVLEFEALPERVDFPTLGHMFRAEEWMAKRQWRRALSELSLASQATNPPRVAAEVAKSTGTCYLRLGEATQAMEQLTKAQTLLGTTEDIELASLIQAVKVDPTRELDRVVTTDEVTESERPLWEAFDDASKNRAQFDRVQPQPTTQPTPAPPMQPTPQPQPPVVPPQPQK